MHGQPTHSNRAPPAANAAAAAVGVAPATGALDRKFIEDHRLLDRYLEGKLPFKGARDLENWCRANPHYLAELKLADRTHASLKLLEASGQPQDLTEQAPPWWKKPQLLVALAVFAVLCLFAFWVLFAKYVLLRGELAEARVRVQQGTLVQPSAQRRVTLVPDATERAGRATITVDHAAPQLVELHLDLSRVNQGEFRAVVDKRDQGRVLVVNGLVKDSNGELRATFNTSGMSAGSYVVRIEALPIQSSPVPVGWASVEVR